MTEFGQQLRKFRHRCHDSKSPQGKLTQERFGDLVGAEFGIQSYTGAAVSDWERGKTKIHADDGYLLMAMIKVLYEYGGIRTIDEANELLQAGNFRNLDPVEEKQIFASTTSDGETEQWEDLDVSQQAEAAVQDDGSQVTTAPRSAQEAGSSTNSLTHPEEPSSGQKISKSPFLSLLGNLLSIPATELQEIISKAEEGPSPSWPRVLAAFMRKTSERISLSPKIVLWVGTWGIAWGLITPSMRWPFANRAAALQAIGMYVIGTLVVPLLIGTLVDTKHNEYWQAQRLANSKLLRLYTYQGAGIGFNLGYFFVLPLIFIRHYLDLGSSSWLEFIAATLGLILGNMSARVVPHNLWLVYHRLRFTDGAIFFVVAFSGPLWGIFFLEYYPLLLTPLWGSAIILIALLLSILIAVQQSKRIDMKQAQP